MKPTTLQDGDIARLVSNVTRVVLGSSATIAPTPKEAPEHLVSLPIHGVPGLVLYVAMNKPGLARLSSAMFGVDVTAVDRAMMKDSLGEFANMAAGQIKAAIEPGHVLGLPAEPSASIEALADARFIDLQAGEIPLRVYVVPQAVGQGAKSSN